MASRVDATGAYQVNHGLLLDDNLQVRHRLTRLFVDTLERNVDPNLRSWALLWEVLAANDNKKRTTWARLREAIAMFVQSFLPSINLFAQVCVNRDLSPHMHADIPFIRRRRPKRDDQTEHRTQNGQHLI